MFIRYLRILRNFAGVLLLLAVAGGVVARTWMTTERSVAGRRAELVSRADTTVTGLAAVQAELINRQILALDQTLDSMVRDWRRDPAHFNLEDARARTKILSGITREFFLTDANGIVRQSSISDFLGADVSGLDVFRVGARRSESDRLFLGEATVNPIMRLWHMDAARTLRARDGSFAGIIDTDYRVSAVVDLFKLAPPPGNGFTALINLTDGKIRAVLGSADIAPGATIADTPMFAAIDGPESGQWTGPSANDAVVRVHAFQRIPDRDLVLITGIDEREVLQPAAAWAFQARSYAVLITSLTVVGVSLVLLALMNLHRRERLIQEQRSQLDMAAALSEISRVNAEAAGRHLKATLASVDSGIVIVDAHLNIAEWNDQFPDRAGVNPAYVRTGMGFDDVLRLQAEAGVFGQVADPDQEAEQRAARLRASRFSDSETLSVHGRFIRMRRLPLPDGGFVAVYDDVTDLAHLRQALGEEQSSAERERSARIRLLGAIAHEISTKVASLLALVGRERRDASGGGHDRALDGIKHAGESLDDLARDIVDLPGLETGTLAPSPVLFPIAPVLRSVVDRTQPLIRTHGLTLYLVTEDGMPAELITDPAWLRRAVAALVAEAVRHAAAETVWLIASPAPGGSAVAPRITVRVFGTPLSDAARAAVFPDFSGIDPQADVTAGGGLGAAVVRHLAALMGGDVRCEAWSTQDGRTGNDFILTLPPGLLPSRGGRAAGAAPETGRPLPRTRILMGGAMTGARDAAITMLRRDGHLVDVAATAAAVEQRLEATAYDIVFLDHDAPGPDLEVTIRQLRDVPGPARDVALVLIGLHVDEAADRRWRGTGVTGFLPAEPSLAELTATIGQQVWHAHSASPGMGFMPGFKEEAEDGIPILSQDRVAELRANIPADTLRTMIDECVSDLFHRLPALRRSLAARSPGAITSHAHAMAGMAGGYGMAVLEARLRAILAAVRNRRMSTIDGAAEMVEADLTRAAAALRRALRLPRQIETDHTSGSAG